MTLIKDHAIKLHMGHISTKLGWLVLALPFANLWHQGSHAEAQDDAESVSRLPTIFVLGMNEDGISDSQVRVESELDENGIASYGLDTVGEVLSEVIRRVGTSSADDPIVLINGRLASGLAEIADLPAEALSKIQLLPMQTAGLLGQSPSRRVINVAIKPDLAQLTANATKRLATAGDGAGAIGDFSFLKLSGGNRRSFSFKLRDFDPLFESDRDIISTSDLAPYDLFGNIISFPIAGSDIDPALSNLVGAPVTIAGVPRGNENPTLADFANTANIANFSDLGSYRSLISGERSIGASGNITQKIGTKTTLSINATGELSEITSFNGATSVNLRLPESSPFSPFTEDVLVARYLDDLLEQRSRSDSFTIAGSLNTQLGRWRVSLNANGSHRVGDTKSERGLDTTAIEAATSAGAINPFAAFPTNLTPRLPLDRGHSRFDSWSTRLSANGSLFSAPAGPVQAALRLEAKTNSASSESNSGATIVSSRRHRDETAAQLSLQLPIIAYAPPVGSIGLELSGAMRDITAIGGLVDHSYGVNWQPVSNLSLRVSRTHEQVAPSPNALTDPVIVLDNIRSYDFVQQETVFVRYTTGGNPNIREERRRTTNASATAGPFTDYNILLNAEYLKVDSRDSFASLPPVNADVQAAFPERFIRDSSGRLIAIDARPVGLNSVNREQFQWGFNFSHSFDPAKGSGAGEFAAGWRVDGSASHQWLIESERQARPGLPVIDLLSGGALGYGGGQSRHQLAFSGGILKNGIGLRVDGAWVDSSRIAAGTLQSPDRIEFSPRTTIDARAFVNLGPNFPTSTVAKGMRISVEVENLFDSKPKVRDSAGETPLGYQPFLMDPLGRTVSVSLRKVF